MNTGVTVKQTILQLFERRAPKLALTIRAHRELKIGEFGLKLAKELADPTKTSIDVGANRGIFSYWLARCSARTIAIEPHPMCQEYIARALRNTVVLVRGGCSDHAGSALLRVPVHAGVENSYRSSLHAPVNSVEGSSFQIEVHRLDDLVDDEVGFVKIDVEGHEREVLLGATGLVDRSRPIVLVEAEDRHREGAVEFVSRFFLERDYVGFFLRNRQALPIGEFDLDLHQRDVTEPGQRDSRYANNFLFVPSNNDSAIQRAMTSK